MQAFKNHSRQPNSPERKIRPPVFTNIGSIFVLISIFLHVTGFVMIKYASLEVTHWLYIFTNLFFIAAVGCIILRVLFWVTALHFLRLSDAYSFTALTPILILVLGAILFGESISAYNLFGGVCIVIGFWGFHYNASNK